MVAQFLTLLAGGLGVSYTLDRWAGHEFPTLLCLATFGSFISYIYSAPPLKLKQSGWIGNYALGSSYIALPWWAGQVGTLICVFVCPCVCLSVCVWRAMLQWHTSLSISYQKLQSLLHAMSHH